MNVTFLKFCRLFLYSVLISLAVKAQDPRFIYIQTDNKQPFYVKLDKQYISSSATGYIIIPKLTAGNYQLTIGFPKTALPELQATIQVKEANAGYLLKRSGDKDWTMVNLQTMEPVAVQKQAQASKEQAVVIAGDEFSRILAEVVNDPSINQVMLVKAGAAAIPAVVKEDAPVIKKEDKAAKQETVKQELSKPAAPPAMAVSAVVKNETEPVAVKEEEPVAGKKEKQEFVKSPDRVSSVVKLSHDSTSGGVLMAYIDRSGPDDDTVKIFIPVSVPVKPAAKAETVKAEPVNKDTRFLDMELQNPNSKPDTTSAHKENVPIAETKKQPEPLIEKSVTKEVKQDMATVITNTACKQTATPGDVSKLRKQMSAEDNERSMTKTAAKQFTLTCFTTEQIKNLGGIFVTEDERYKFYVAAFPYVADRHNFATLEEQLTDIYYKTRFKAMLAH